MVRESFGYLTRMRENVDTNDAVVISVVLPDFYQMYLQHAYEYIVERK